MVVSKKEISLLGVLAFLSLFYTALFQLGYFRVIGIEFISLISIEDVLLPMACISFPLLILWPLFAKLASKIFTELDEQQFYQTRFGRWTLIMSGMPYWWWLLVLGTVIAASVTLSEAVPFFWSLALVLFWFVLSVLFIYDIRQKWEDEDCIDLSKAAVFLLVSGVLVQEVGGLYVSLFAGKRCFADLVDKGHIDASYLRSTSAGHLFRIGKRTIFVPSSQLLQISCGRMH